MKTKLFFIFIFYVLSHHIFGQKYENYTEEGLASYYTEKFEGRITASNEKFNGQEMVGSHKKLPFGTKVLVTNLANNKEVTIRINDRGPYAYGRIMDISQAAAEKIGLIETGTAKISIKVISVGKKNDPKVEIDKPYLKENKVENTNIIVNNKYILGKMYNIWGTEQNPKGFGIQLGSMQSAEASLKYCKKISQELNGKEKIFMAAYKNDIGNIIYKVFLGEYEDEKVAKNNMKKYASVIGTQTLVKRY
ncbi:MAG: septal ring lytic transglycosylase RlpA family protein [Bacteroidetes bacterium]|nr:MAG: septal ring lytic transglycosylase RlpA family protein [Bacteroidota bacterium]